MNEPIPKLGRLAVAREFASLAVAAASPDVEPHVLLARTRKTLDWLEAGAPPKEARAKTTPAMTEDVQAVFRHWCVVMRKPGSTKLTPDRVKRISDRLKEGATVEHCKLAIDGCKNSPMHMGKNDTNTVYNSIDLIFRSGDKLDDFASKAPKWPGGNRPAPVPAKPKKKPEKPVTAEEAARFSAELAEKMAGFGERGMASLGSLLPKVGP